jgi:hypothetical protein
MKYIKQNIARLGAMLASVAVGLALMASPTSTQAAQGPKGSHLNIIPTVTNLVVNNGQLLASGVATATIKGRSYSAPFSNIPVNIALAGGTNAPGTCPVLSLSLGPIDLDLLGAIVQTSPICLDITAIPGGGLLGNLLCGVSTGLLSGLSLDQILGALGANDLGNLLGGLTDLLNGVLGNLLQSVLTGIGPGSGAGECAVLHLALGPLNLTLLGLNVVLDNCSGGPVTVDLTAHHGGLLGNLLCSLAGHGGLNLGTLLGDILGGLLDSGPL